MNKHEVIAEARKTCGVSRLDPRRLFLIEDGAYTWIGDRADLTAKSARDLQVIHLGAIAPDRATADDRALYDAIDYDAICNSCRCISATHGSAGPVKWDDLPDDWKDGSALGPIKPL